MIRLGSVDPELGGDVETIVANALAKDPARRFQTPAELVRELAVCASNPADRPTAEYVPPVTQRQEEPRKPPFPIATLTRSWK